MSQYTTVNELLGNWDVLTAEHMTFPDATAEVRRLLSRIALERCFRRKLWPDFRFFALVRPDNDTRRSSFFGKQMGRRLTLHGHDNSVVSVAWSPDSKRLATAIKRRPHPRHWQALADLVELHPDARATEFA